MAWSARMDGTMNSGLITLENAKVLRYSRLST
jgi:hypothetical protein